MFPDWEGMQGRLGSTWSQANADGKDGLINPNSVAVLGPMGTPRVCWHKSLLSEVGTSWSPSYVAREARVGRRTKNSDIARWEWGTFCMVHELSSTGKGS